MPPHTGIRNWTVFKRAIADDKEFSKVSFSMKRVAGSFAGELLLQRNDYRDFRNKALKDNAFNNIEAAILR